jgi:subtilisin-like proprotein convertase family protein
MKKTTRWALVLCIAAIVFMLVWDFTPRASMKGNKEKGKGASVPTPTVAPSTAYRSPGERHKVSISDPQLAESLRQQGGRIVADYGSYKLLEVDTAAANTLLNKNDAQLADENNLVLLNAGAIDTSTPAAQAMRGGGSVGSGKQMRLIQFAGPIQPAWYEALVKTGVRVVTYIPNNAYLVYGSARNLQAMQSLTANPAVVQWDGAYTSAQRLAPSLTAVASGKDGSKAVKEGATKNSKVKAQANLTAKGNELFAIQLVADKTENATTLALIDRMKLEPVLRQAAVLDYVNVIVALPREAVINELAARGDVVSIAPWSMPHKMDERQDMIIAGNLTGSAPTPGDYLAYLAGKGFAATTTSFGVNISDSGVDNGTTTPGHFGLYALGNPTAPANSRIVYARVVGTPTGPGSTTQGCDGHGNLNTHVIGGYVPTGTVGGVNFNAAPHADASGFRYGLGVMPYVKIGSSVIFDNSGAPTGDFTSPNYTTLESSAYNDTMRVSSNSWGASDNSYTIDAQEYDALVRDAQPTGATFPAAGNQEYTIIFAAGNDGSGAGTVGEPGTAKNVITVGASENVLAFGGADGCGIGDTGADNANDVISFSSRGPTADGRKKPEIIAPGTHVTGGVGQASIASPTGSGNGSAIACFNATGVCAGPGGSDFFPVGQQYYTASDGTSHSTPAMAGYAALIRQYFINQSLTPPSPALTKAMMMNTARYLTGVGANDSLYSNTQGMGEANFNGFFDLFTTGSIRRDEVAADKFTASGQQRVFTGTINNNAKPFRVTLAWTDPPGPTSGNAFVNNLDLEVTVGGNTYLGNVFTGANSATGGSADTRNNVESVFVPAGVSGNFVVKVKATNIAGNGVPGDADALDQDFALVVANATAASLPVIQGGTPSITAESCAPANMAIDPGETVTVSLPLSNVGTADTSNLVATLQATGGVNSPSGPQTYGMLTQNGPAVSKSFTFTADPSLICGSNITLTLHLMDGAADLGNVSFVQRVGGLGAPSTTLYSTGNIATPIPDVSSVDVPIVISQTGAIADVNVRVRLNHTFDHDLVLELVAPDGTTVSLAANRDTATGGGDNYGTGNNDCSGTPTIFDDAAATAIGAGTPPFAGTFKPETPLAALNGHSLAGTWKLHITDVEALDTGTVGCVTLEIARQPFLCCGVSGTPVMGSGGNATITAESVSPANNAPDPGETLTATFPLVNTGDGNTTNLVATLQSSGGVTPVTPTANYGVVVAGGPAVAQPFTFVASGTCGTNITATLQLQDGAVNLGTQTYTFRLGTTSSAAQTFSNATAIVIPATGTGATTGAPATPYPSNITVAGITAPVSKVTITLKQISHTFPSDVDVLLVGPTGRKFVAMSDVIGGTDWTGQTYTLDDDAAALLPSSGTPPASGSFKPTNYGTGDAFPAPAPAAPYRDAATAGTETFASSFAGQDPNGTWSLYVVDDAGTDIGTFAGGWDLTITTTQSICNAQACSITCPANITVPADMSGTGAVVNYPAANVTGACGVLNYSTPSGSTFPVGTTQVNVTGASPGACAFNVTVTSNAPAISTTLAISEFREHGAAGAADEYIELVNMSNAPFTVNASDASAGWSVAALNAAGTVASLVGTIPNGTVIPARGHYLLANSTAGTGYSLGASATPDATFTADIPDNVGLALFNSANVANLTAGTRVDGVGFTGQSGALPTLFAEGTTLAPTGTANGQYAYVRRMETGVAQDTGNNAADFVFVAPDAGTYGGVGAVRGAPGPENLASALQRNATIKPSLIDPSQAATDPPNRVRDTTPGSGATAQGTLDIRRKFTNTTGGAVTALRFRIVDVTTTNTPNPGGAQADLRLLTSVDTTANGGTITIKGTTLQAPADATSGGGLNASGVVALPGGALANGASINVRFVLGVAQGGRFRFFVNVEALP